MLRIKLSEQPGAAVFAARVNPIRALLLRNTARAAMITAPD
jgi:hypothetical protein